MPDHIELRDLAAELAMDRSHLRKYVLSNGFTTVNVRSAASRGQQALAVTEADAAAIRALRARQGFTAGMTPVETCAGSFYIVQLVPDLDPLRVKLGFAVDLPSRVDAHRTAAPTATLVKAWPCRRVWEPAAIASITRTGCRLIASEVYACDDLAALVARADDFFSRMA
jgi:hypothetical protein